jgi:AcrR family transcriptional regulator
MGTSNSKGQDGHSSPFNRTAQHDAKRTAILSQAAKLFNSKGSRATTLRDIAETLGLTKTSLYYYVKTKEELIYQCYMAALAHHHHTLDDIERQHADPFQRLSSFFRRQFEDWQAAHEGRAPHIAALLEIAALKQPHRDEVEGRYIGMFKRLRGYLQDGIASGGLRKCEPTSATRAILGSADWIFFWLHRVPRQDVQATAAAALDILAHGISAGDGVYPLSGMSTQIRQPVGLQGFNREEQNRLKQEAFFKTGTWFFNKQGFNGTSLDEIAEQLNVSKGAFYYHIKNKEDLLFHCYVRSLGIVEDIHEQARAHGSNGMARAEFTCRHTFYTQNSEQGPLIRYNTITALPPQRRREILKRTDRANKVFTDFLSEGIEDGSVRPIDTFVATQLITGASNAAMDIKLWRRVDDIDAAAIDYFDIFFNGLLPRSGAAK